jgi:two-component system NarL family sensor kinase
MQERRSASQLDLRPRDDCAHRVRSAPATVKIRGVRARRDRRRPRTGPGSAAPPSIGTAVARFALGSLVAVAVVVVAGYFALRSVAINEAERSTRQAVEIEGRLVSQGLTDALLKRDPEAIAKVDDLVVTQVLPPSAVKDTPPIVRVKIWAEDGTVLYSDVRALIGKRYVIGDEERELLETGGADAELSDLTKPENRFERQFGKLLEAHTMIRTPSGTPVLFEIYQQFSSVSTNAGRLLAALAPPLLAGLAVLLLSQVPLAYSMARRLQRGHREREGLLNNAIEASTQERRRIASDLHDGVVQDLAGVAFGLAPIAEDAERRGDQPEARALRDSMSTLRQGVRDLRTLLVEIHPPSLESTGIEAALNDLLSPLQADGIATELHVDDRATAGSNGDALIYRVAREALRNTQKYAQATSVRIDVTRPEPDMTRLVVADDGKGFIEADRERRKEEGHVGLTLLESLVRQSNGTLEVRSQPGKGTTVELEVPVW